MFEKLLSNRNASQHIRKENSGKVKLRMAEDREHDIREQKWKVVGMKLICIIGSAEGLES
jgi:hypothetical protein